LLTVRFGKDRQVPHAPTYNACKLARHRGTLAAEVFACVGENYNRPALVFRHAVAKQIKGNRSSVKE